MEPHGEFVILDRETEPWLGRFPGLGSVRVWADGSLRVDVDPRVGNDPDEEQERRAGALRDGWGEALSLLRQGFGLLRGTACAAPGSGRCLLLHGDALSVAAVVVALVRGGWGVAADRLVPIGRVSTGSPDGSLRVQPRRAPAVVPEQLARAAGLAVTPIRDDSDAVALAGARVEQPVPLAAIVVVRPQRVGEPAFVPVDGHRRFAIANGLFARGVLEAPGADDGTDAPLLLAEALGLAGLPFAELRIAPAALSGQAGPELGALLSWWDHR